MSSNPILLHFFLSLPALFIALVVHEFAHGYVANMLGDNTAKQQGRLTFNPFAHIDLFYTILLPLFLILSRSPVVIGMAKPVPVDPRNFKNPRKDMLWVSLAGPTANFIIAFIIHISIRFGLVVHPQVIEFFLVVYWINLILGVFNLIPIPPLDGSGILMGLLPIKWARMYARVKPIYGMAIIIGGLVILQLMLK